MMTAGDRARYAFDAADAAHELQRYLLSIAERLRRNEELDRIVVGSFLPTARLRIDTLIAHALDDQAAIAETARLANRRQR